jgi:hypothetical protein
MLGSSSLQLPFGQSTPEAAPAPLVRGETRRLAETREIDKGHYPLILQLGEHSAAATPWPGTPTLDVDLEEEITVVTPGTFTSGRPTRISHIRAGSFPIEA